MKQGLHYLILPKQKMAILPKSSSAQVTLTSWAQAAQEKVGPFLEATKTLTLQTVFTSKAILDRYPPIKVFHLNPRLSFIALVFFR